MGQGRGVPAKIGFVYGIYYSFGICSREFCPDFSRSCRRGGIDQVYYYFGLDGCIDGALDADALDGVVGVLAESCCVLKSDKIAAEFYAVFHDVACGAVDFAYYCAFVAYKGVEQ